MTNKEKLKIIKEITPKYLECVVASCPAIFKTNNSSYVLIGKIVNAKELGLSKRIGKDEILIEVPKDLIDKKK